MQTAPTALNAAGMVVGGLRPTVDALPAFIYGRFLNGLNSKDIRRELSIPPGATWVFPKGINARAQIVGFANERTRQTNHAVIWEWQPAELSNRLNAALKIEALDDNSAVSSEAAAINNRGEIVGARWTPDGICHACRWHNGLQSELDRQNRTDWRPTGINDTGDIVGWGLDALNRSHLFHWHDNILTDLGRGYQIALNQRGQIAGDYEIPEHLFRACIWNGNLRADLPMLSGTNESHALALNDRGQIVGRAVRVNTMQSRNESGAERTDYGMPHPVLWEGGSVRDLNTLLPVGTPYVLEEAIGINDTGQILCTARQGIWGRAVLLTPIDSHWTIECF